MRVHDEIRDDALVAEGHVDVLGDETDHPFLAVAAAELVADFGSPGLSHQQLDEGGFVAVGGDHHFLHVGWLDAFQSGFGGRENIDEISITIM